MAIDIRADVTCSLGPVIAGNIGDDYIQGSGLIKTTGSVTINDLITPDINTIVTFSYTKNGITRSIPRTLRVKSSFADPFRRTTQVELGCKLDYLSDLKDQLAWDAFNDPENNALTEEDAKVITIPIHASSVMNECLAQLGITASSNPLTNKFSIAEFDFSSGYFSVLSDLLVSESYCGYLDANEVLQVFSLNQGPATGPVITGNDIIDLSPIGVGNLPGEAVTVSYSTLRLKLPEGGGIPPEDPEEQQEYENEIARINWERSEVYNSPQLYFITTKAGSVSYSGSSSTITETNYRVITVFDDNGDQKDKEVPSTRTTTVTGPAIEKLSACASAYLNNGQGNFNNAQLILSLTRESFVYDSLGREIRAQTTVYEPEACILAGSQFDWVYGGENFVASYDLMISKSIVNTKEYLSDMVRETTSEYTKWAKTAAGTQAISISNDSTDYQTPVEALGAAIDILGSGLVHNNTTQTINTSGATPERPPAAERTIDALAKDGAGGGSYGTENNSELELALGSAEAQRRIEFSMPYAPDDTFYALGLGGYGVIASDAPAKANLYGRVQNNLLLGNRSGVSLRLAPEKLPTKPFDPIYLDANGLTAQYRVNAATWAFDSNGIVCSTDALFWGAVGGTGSFWFPVAPGITTLPSTPPIVDTSPTEVIGSVLTVGATPQTFLNTTFPDAVDGDGVQDQTSGDFWVYDGATWTNVGPTPGPTITTTSLVPSYNQTIIYNSRIRLVALVSKFDYALSLLTIVPAIRLRIATKLGVVESSTVATIALNAPVASVTSGSISIPVDSSNTTILGLTLIFAGDPNTIYVNNTVNIAIAAPPVPEQPAFIVFNFDGTDGSTSITSSSSSVGTVTATVTGTAALSTFSQKFGTAALYFDTNPGLVQFPIPQAFGLNDFCVEFWIFVPVELQGTNNYSTSYSAGAGSSVDADFSLDQYLLYFPSLPENYPVADIVYDEYQHIAVYRINGTIYLAVDGVVAANTVTTSYNFTNTYQVIGDYDDFEGGVGGYATLTTWIDELRVTLNSSVYGATDFTPPSSPF